MSPAETLQPSTEFRFTTKVEDLTTSMTVAVNLIATPIFLHLDTQCDNVTQKSVESCDEESAKHSASPITSVLPLLPDAATEVLADWDKRWVFHSLWL